MISSRLVDGGYAAGWTLVKTLPEPVARAAFTVAAELTWRRRGPSVRRLEANLRRVLGPGASDGQLATVTRAALPSYLRYWLEVFRLPVLGRDRLLREFSLEGADRLFAAYAAGNGVVVALPHAGNWDIAGAWLVARGVPFTTVAERLEPASLFRRFVAFRESIGMSVLPASGGSEVFRELTRRLRAGAALCLVADRDLSASGVEVTFFGEPARLPAGPAALALATGAPLLPATLWYAEEGRGWCGRVHAPINPPQTGTRREKIATMTQALADAFAGGIAAHPADWHLLQPLWVADLDPARTPAPAARSGAAA